MRMSIPEYPYPSPEPNSPHVPVWTPAQFKGAAKAKMRKMHELEEYSLGEAIANAVSNGVGAALSIAALVILVVTAVMHGGGLRVLVALAFAIPMMLAFLMSTLYHAIPVEASRRVFKVLGHCFVFFYIAGAMTPFFVLAAPDEGGLVVLGIEWTIAVAGVLVECIWLSRPKWVPIVLCLAMLVLGFTMAPAFSAALAPAGWNLLVASVVCFVAGLVIYMFRRVPYLWFVSHLLVLGGSVCLFLSVVLFVI